MRWRFDRLPKCRRLPDSRWWTELSASLSSWFVTRWRGNGHAIDWTIDLLESLAELVSTIPCWQTVDDGEDQREFLQLDKDRIEECVEAWVRY